MKPVLPTSLLGLISMAVILSVFYSFSNANYTDRYSTEMCYNLRGTCIMSLIIEAFWSNCVFFCNKIKLLKLEKRSKAICFSLGDVLVV